MHIKKQWKLQAADVEPQCGMDRSCGQWTLTWIEHHGQELSWRIFSVKSAGPAHHFLCIYLFFYPFQSLSISGHYFHSY